MDPLSMHVQAFSVDRWNLLGVGICIWRDVGRKVGMRWGRYMIQSTTVRDSIQPLEKMRIPLVLYDIRCGRL